MLACAFLGLLLAISAGDAAARPPRDGEWRQFRRDGTLAGRCPLRGDIRRPAVRWSRDLSARITMLAVRVSARAGGRLELPAGDVSPTDAAAFEEAWGIGAPRYDLDGDGRKTPVAPWTQSKVAHLLPGELGLQRVEFESGFDKSGGAYVSEEPIVGRLFVRRDGRWVERWRTEPVPMLYAANAICGRFSGSGAMEIAIVPWYDLWLLDAATGRTLHRCRFTPEGAESGRAYGWLGAHDLDGDGRSEFVVIGDFENFVSVIGWRDGKLARLWTRLFERGIAAKRTIVRMGVEPVQDVDGDGRAEIVLSLFDTTGDGRWHTTVLDGMTGAPKLDQPGVYAHAAADLDGDGQAELLCTETCGARVPSPGRLFVAAARGDRLDRLWEAHDAAWVEHDRLDPPEHINTGSATAWRTVLVAPRGGGRPLFFTRRVLDATSGRTELTGWRASSVGRFEPVIAAVGPRLTALGARGQGDRLEALLQARLPCEDRMPVRVRGGAARVVASSREPAPISVPVAGALRPGEPLTVVAQDACERVVAFRPGEDRLRWAAPGRGGTTGDVRHGGGALFNGVALADLRGDGALSVLAATSGPGGCGRLVAYGPDGRVRWAHDEPGVPGGPPPWNIGGVTLWCAGRFRTRDRDDVLLNIRRSTMHSDEMRLLDGRTGAVVWSRAEGTPALGFKRGMGGSPWAIVDHDGDGLDDAVTFYPDLMTVLRGANGDVLLERHTPAIFPRTAFYAMPVAADLLGSGERVYLYGGSSYELAVVDREGRARWHEGPSARTPAALQGVADVDGDGRLELVSVGHVPDSGDGIEARCYEAASGRVRWRARMAGVPFGPNGQWLAGAPTTCATADLDGDGREECVFAVGQDLVCVGERDGSGAVLWRLTLPATAGPPSIACTGAGGALEIIVICADGRAYGVGAAPANPSGR